MRRLSNDFTKYLMYFVFSIMAVGFSGCSSDDDADDIIDPRATGSIIVQDNQTISENIIVVETVTVSQDSWVVAVMGGEENTNNFISDPVLVDAGTTSNVELTINNEVDLTSGEAGNAISIKLYADNPDEGLPGEWDENDEPIMGIDGTLATETITVFVEESQTFADFDANSDGTLDADEVPNTYQNNFEEWDADADGFLNEEEFFNTTFGNTDADKDGTVNQDEWNAGFTGMYGNHAEEDDFGTFDTNADGTLSSEEWMAGFGETTWFTTYDADVSTSISEDEWNTGLFNDWDTDGDGIINEDEFNIYSPYTNSW